MTSWSYHGKGFEARDQGWGVEFMQRQIILTWREGISTIFES
jgi:hypothetical protein